jgi:hypothetical protein
LPAPDLLARRAGGEVEVILIERLDRGETRYAHKHLAGPRPAGLTFSSQQLFDEVGERSVLLGRLLCERGVLRRDPAEPELVAQLHYSLMLDAHPTSAEISSSYTLSECW